MFLDTKMWADMFSLGLPVLEKILRAAFVYVFLIVVLRLAGKRELAQMNPFDFVVLLTLSNAVQNAIIGDDNTVIGGWIGAGALVAINMLVVRFLYGRERLERLVEGSPDLLIENGQVNHERLKCEMITVAELERAARKQGFASLGEVERAELEPEGGITFVASQPKPEEARHQELMQRLDRVLEELAALRGTRPREA
jgi:uncharacterized membrane protein YcaP (DUF421 family)